MATVIKIVEDGVDKYYKLTDHVTYWRPQPMDLTTKEAFDNAQCQVVDGKYYRLRRGVRVEIPAEWVGRMTTKKTIRERKHSKKRRKSGG